MLQAESLGSWYVHASNCDLTRVHVTDPPLFNRIGPAKRCKKGRRSVRTTQVVPVVIFNVTEAGEAGTGVGRGTMSHQCSARIIWWWNNRNPRPDLHELPNDTRL